MGCELVEIMKINDILYANSQDNITDALSKRKENQIVISTLRSSKLEYATGQWKVQ